MAISFFKDEEEKKKYLEELQAKQKEYAQQEEARRQEAIKDVEWINPNYTVNNADDSSTWDKIALWTAQRGVSGVQSSVLDTLGSIPQSMAVGYNRGAEQARQEESATDKFANVLKNIMRVQSMTDPISFLLFNATVGRDDFINNTNQAIQQTAINMEKADNGWGKAGALLGGVSSYALQQGNPVVQNIYAQTQLAGDIAGAENAEKARDALLKFDEDIHKGNDQWSEDLAERGKNYGDVANFIGDTANTIGYMTPSIALTAIGGGAGLSESATQALGLTQMGLASKGQSTREALKEGLDLESADRKGIASGSAEAGSEMMFSGLKAFKTFRKSGFENTARKWIEDTVEKDIKSALGKKLTKSVGNWLLDVAGESIEEVTTDIYNTWLDNATTDPNKQYTLEDAKNTVLQTIASTTALNAGHSILNKTSNQNVQQNNNQPLNQYSLEEKTNDSAFKYEKSDNAKIDAFRQEASNLLNDSEATHNFAQVIEKVIEDKNYNVRLNPNLTDSNGNMANGTIKTLDNGEVEITLNPNSKRAGEFILTHEITHAIATNEMRTLVNDYMQKDTKFADAVKSLQTVYNTNEISDEVLADVSGQLFGNQEFINQLSMDKPNVFKRLYNKIIELANKVTGNSNESLFIKDLKNKWEQAYRENYNNLESNKSSVENTQNNRFDVTDNDNLTESGTVFFRKRDDGKYNVQATNNAGNLIYEGTFTDKNALTKTLGEDIANYIVNNSSETNNELYIENNNNKPKDYKMSHRPFHNETENYGNASNFEKSITGDVFKHPEYYWDMSKDYSKESFEALKKVRNNPDAEITIYRATPSDTINEGDWVTPSRKYAEMHNESQLDGKGNILGKKVKASEVIWGGDDINEFGYAPQIKENVANNQNLDYNNENGGDIYAERYNSNVGRRVQNVLEDYQRGQTVEERSDGSLQQKQSKGTTQDDVKRALIDFANEYRKTELNQLEKNISEVYKKLGGDVVFYEYGKNNAMLGLSDTNKIYIDSLSDEDITNIAYHELAHFLRQNNNETYINEIQPIVDEIADNEDFQEVLFNYAKTRPDLEIGMLESKYKKILAEEVIADTFATLKGNLGVDYGLSNEQIETIENALNRITNKESQEGSFNLANKRYQKENINWKDYLESKFKASGTRTKLEDIKLPVRENVETKLPVNEEAVKKNTSNNNHIVENTKDFFNKDMYNELTSNKDMFEGVTESELKEGLKQLYEVQLDDELKTGNYKEDNSRKRTYMRYKNTITEYNKDVLNTALDKVKANRNDRRTVNQWLDVAKQIGQNSGDLNAKQIQDLAFGSWFDLKPNTHDSITKYDNVAKERVPYKRLTSDDWVNTIYDNAKQAKLNQFEEALNKEVLPVKETIAETKPNLETITEIEEPKDRVMPVKNKTAEEVKIAKVLSQPVEKQKTAQRAWALIKANLIDKGAVFEDISLKTKNRELQSKWDSTLLSGAKGQYAIGNTRYDFDNGKQTQINKALTDIIDEVGTDADAFQNYMYHQLNVDRMTLQDRFGTENKPVFGKNIGAEYSKQQIAEYEKNYPEFKEYAQDVYDYLDANKQELVKSGVISQELADKFKEMYPHYVPIARVDKNNQSIAVPLDTKRTGVNSPIKKAKGGSQDIQPLFQTIADKTLQTYRASARNSFGVELKNTLDKLNMLNQSNENVDVDTIMDTMNDEEHTGLTEGTKTQNPTFTVFENGEKVTYEINQDMYDALKPKSELLSKIDNSTPAKILNKVSNFRRGVLTEYNPVFSLTNAIKDAQDVLMNSQHATKTYAKFPEAYAQILKKGYWYQEYVQNGGEQNSYFKDGDFEVKDTSAKGKVKSALKMPLEAISRVNNVIEMAPRLAEYIASREAGRSVETSMLDASRVTTNFKAGGDITKTLNRNGVTFLNASVQGMTQNIRNVREANAKGLKGYAVLAGKTALAGLPALILNNLVWGDDDDYEDLQDYVKDNYYIIGKVGDHQFLRIPKGRVVSVIQKIVSNADEFINNKNELNADELAKSFWKDLQEDFSLAMSNVAPNNPLENNVVSPIKQAVTNKTWYGSDLVPSRLQKKPTKEQYDETTAEISKNISNALNAIGINSNPMAINYILDQYGGGVSDILLPMGTPQAENNVLEDKFTTNSVMKAKYAGDFFSKYDELTVNKNASNASDEDVAKYKYFSSVREELNGLYQQKREIQNSNKTDEAKKKELEKVQQQINDKAKKALEEVKKPKVSGNTATVGGVDFVKTKNAKTQEYEWEKVEEDDKIDGVSLKTYTDYMNKASEELSKQRKSGEISEKGQLKDKDKIQILKNSNYTDAEKKAIYTDKIGTNDNLYKNVLSNSSIDIDEYLDYKTQDFEADKDDYGQSISGTSKQKRVDYINNNISGYENRLLLIASKYKITNAEEKQKLVQWINKQPNKMDIYEQLSDNFIVHNNKVYYK